MTTTAAVVAPPTHGPLRAAVYRMAWHAAGTASRRPRRRRGGMQRFAPRNSWPRQRQRTRRAGC